MVLACFLCIIYIVWVSLSLRFHLVSDFFWGGGTVKFSNLGWEPTFFRLFLLAYWVRIHLHEAVRQVEYEEVFTKNFEVLLTTDVIIFSTHFASGKRTTRKFGLSKLYRMSQSNNNNSSCSKKNINLNLIGIELIV